MYDRILVPINERDDTHRPIAEAIALADEVGASIYTIHVINKRTYESLDDEHRAEREADARKTLAAVRAASPVDIRVETSLRYGVPHRELLEATTDLDADVIVAGTRGRTGVDRALAGSIAELLVRRAPVPVLTVRLTAETRTTATADGAIDRTLTALETAGQEVADALAEPYRTTGSGTGPTQADDR